ncbi:hypothetical protein FCL40_15890 [Ferrimonas sediminicola]|uniref:Uncharacterized protein n=1 Tax=Ferrimonas sediminicola TaxID=2569538 RepID=A0A4U1BBD6_9GAMM|nr:hypothetical protein [Ferrimonas sediminicola]TKB47329.1 hypothetical protein FCL40_15890 [Ferrimonas sediminicola]
MNTEASGQTEGMPTTPLSDSLPHHFDNGAIFHGFTAQCDACAGPIGVDQMTGSVHPLPGNRCILIAQAYCLRCGHLCHYHYLLEADGEMAATRLGSPGRAN